MPDHVYVLGTGLSHDGAACLLKDGIIHVAIEKERISRIKHDGGNDSLTVQYCLDAAGITLNDIALVVQCSNFEKEEIQKHLYKGRRFFPADTNIPFVTISHHLAHAWSAAGTCPFDQCNIMVIDGCGSFHHQCDDLEGAFIPPDTNSLPWVYGEKDSFYFFDGKKMNPLYKDFSPLSYTHERGMVYLPTSDHSIGGLYAMASHYCLGDVDAAGKLMGLAPYGNRSIYTDQLFCLREGRVWVNEKVMHRHFTKPADAITHPFNDHFQYYADIAAWVQSEAERAITYIMKHRLQMHPHKNLAYAGGVALNAVANSKIIEQTHTNLYIEPAAGDNGLALGCAFYGWIEVLKNEKIKHNGSTCFGKVYDRAAVETSIKSFTPAPAYQIAEPITTAAQLLAQGKTIGWFQLGSEFGPRALGRRSILADPRIPGIQHHINQNIKLREDFRPFAPAVLYGDKDLYFKNGYESPYMILIDQIKEEWEGIMPGIVHVDGTCRVQTVNDPAEPFYQLLHAFKELTGISVLLNTSFNRMSQPIVETPEQALQFFYESQLDALVINDFIFTKV